MLSYLHLLLIQFKSWSPVQEELQEQPFPSGLAAKVYCWRRPPCSNRKYFWLQILCKICGDYCTLHKKRGVGWGGVDIEAMKPRKLIYTVWSHAIKFTTENICNHSFYMVIFWVFCKWNLIAHHKWFWITFLIQDSHWLSLGAWRKLRHLRKPLKVKFFFKGINSGKITTSDENSAHLKHECVKQNPPKVEYTIYTYL